MMSKSLYRLGHLAARRPWVVIGAWLVLAIGRRGGLQRLRAPAQGLPAGAGLDSQQASELMAAAGAE